ncbi:DUF2255 family protein [Pedobacter nototheniae]|uniref:DUF2255 family protein n=1 Tax=Pedobacter nototheniae TaxID=2488994 RepID=UPI00292CD2C1|nr:DUF2255 family protein [Pedobacter nototheniae]
MPEHQQFTAGELLQINNADDLKISPFRADGITYGTPTWIWSVVVNDNLYVRAYNGIKSRWYQSAILQKTGQIHTSGMIKDVSFETADASINNNIDEAYRTKYSKSPYLASMISDHSKAATIKILLKNKLQE